MVRHSAKACHTGLFCLSDHLTAEKRRARFTLLDHRKSPALRGFVAGRRSLATTSLYLAQNRTGRKPFDHPGEGRAQTRTSGPKRWDTIPAGRRPVSFSKSAHSGPQGQTAGTSHRGCGNKKRRLHNVQPPTWVAVRRICCTNWLERSAALLWRRREKHNRRRAAAARQGWADAVRRRRGSADPRSLGARCSACAGISHSSVIVMSALCSDSMSAACSCVCVRSRYRSRTEEQS